MSEQSGWMPIETAPRHVNVLLWGPIWRHPFVGQVAVFNGFDHAVIDLGGCDAVAHASHWMPLPSPPKEPTP